MSVRRSLGWAFSSQFLTFVVAFGGSVLVARLLSPHELGIFAIAIATQAIIQIFVSFGIGSYVVRDAKLEPSTLDAAFTINAILSVLLSALLFAASYGGKTLFGDAAAGDVLRISALGPLLGIFGFRPSVMLQREMQFKRISLVNVASGICLTSTTVLLAFLGFSYMSPAYGMLASTILSTSLFVVLGRHHASLRLSFVEWRAITGFGLRMMSLNGMGALAARLCDVILGRIVGIAALGLYGRASNLSNLIWSNVYGTGAQIIFVQMSKEFRETGQLRATFVRSLQMITAIMWPLLLGIAILAKPMIHLLYGEKWLAAAVPLSCLMVMQAISLCYAMNWELFVLRDETVLQTRLEFTRSIVGLVLFTLGCQFSLTGAALGRVADACLGIVLYYPHVKRLAGTQPGEIREVLLQGALLGAVAIAPALVLMVHFEWSAEVSYFLIVPAIIMGAGGWLALLARLKHPLMEELLILARRVPGIRRMACL